MVSQLVKFPITNIVQAKSAVSTILRMRGIELDGGHASHIRTGLCAHYFYSEPKSGRKHYIKFGREPFGTFGKSFREFSNTIGETIDSEVLEMLKTEDVLYFAYPSAVYFIQVKRIKDSGRDRINETDGAKTISFPISMLERLDEVEELR